jgi:hypothetical protein
MPAKLRHAKERRPAFSTEAVSLFCQLEAVLPRHRDSDEFLESDRKLAEMLSLGDEWICSGASVTNRTPPSLWPRPSKPAYADWVKVRATREALLEAAGRVVTGSAAPAGTGAAQNCASLIPFRVFQQTAKIDPLFDHLVGAKQDRLRHRKAHNLRISSWHGERMVNFAWALIASITCLGWRRL